MPILTAEDVARQINLMSPDDAEDSGAKLIDEYVAQNVFGNPVKSFDISDKLEPYLSDTVKAFWKVREYAEGKLWELGDIDTNDLHACFMSVVINIPFERSIAGDGEIYQEEFEKFANFINKARDRGLIGYGALMNPIKIPLARISPVIRTLLIFPPMSLYSIEELKAISNIFTREGELGHNLDEIYFKD